MVQWSLSDARKATAVLSHAWRVIGVLLVQLASTVPFQGPLLLAALIAARPDKESWLGECFPSEEIAHALLADGARYLRAISTLSDRMSLEEAWRLCRWRSFDTLLVLEAACSALCVSRSDALRALVLTLDLQCCAMFDLEEFCLTSVRDPVSGLVTLCTLAEDKRQLNVALLIHKRVPSTTSPETAIKAKIEEWHQECLLLLQELKVPQLMSAYEKARQEFINVKL